MKKLFLIIVVIFAAYLCRAQWEPDVRLTNAPDTSRPSYGMAWSIASSGDIVHVVWCDKRDGNWEIYYKRSTDGGISWEPDQRLTNDPGKSRLPCIAVSDSVVHVIWQDNRDGNNEIYYKRSPDNGSTWSADTRLTYEYVNSYEPSISVSGSVVHLVWTYYGAPYYIYYKRSTDGGLTWGPDVQLTNVVESYNPSIAVSGDNVHIVWNDNRDGDLQIYYKRSTDGGITWGADTRLTYTGAILPSIATSGSNVHVAFCDYRDGANPEIYYKRSTNGGTSWEADTRLTYDPGVSFFPNLALSGSVVHLVWEDNRDWDFKIFYKRSEDGGISWEADTELTNTDNMPSLYPSISVSGSVVHVVSCEWIDSNFEIFYKRNPTGGFPVGIEDDLGGSSGQQICIYPNPASAIIHIDLNGFSNDTAVLTIRNILGEEMLKRQIRNGEAAIDVSGLQNGLYFVGVVTARKQVDIRKLIILK